MTSINVPVNNNNSNNYIQVVFIYFALNVSQALSNQLVKHVFQSPYNTKEGSQSGFQSFLREKQKQNKMTNNPILKLS